MSEVKGKLVTCNRCGKTHFKKFIENVSADGGYSSYDRYEELPSEWLYETQFGHLCDTCANEFRYWITSFMNGKVAPAWTDPTYTPYPEDLA